jgi:hypothetical protein
MAKENSQLSIKVILAGGAAAFGIGSQLLAQAPLAPRGVDISPIASGCGIAKIPQTNKAGPYNQLCDELSDAEKCLAIVKDQIYSRDYKFRPISSDDQKTKMAICIEIMKKDFGIESIQFPDED